LNLRWTDANVIYFVFSSESWITKAWKVFEKWKEIFRIWYAWISSIIAMQWWFKLWIGINISGTE
jgi:hypothetical protein